MRNREEQQKVIGKWQPCWPDACAKPCHPGSGSHGTPELIASHAGIYWGARFSCLPTNACSTEDNIPFPSLANHIVLSKFWKVDLDVKVI